LNHSRSFLLSIVVFVIAGLYETRSVILARRAFSITLLVAQTFNVALAAAFFFLIPIFGIAPKIILGIYLIVSFLLILFWRVWIFPWLGLQKPERAAVLVTRRSLKSLLMRLAKHTALLRALPQRFLHSASRSPRILPVRCSSIKLGLSLRIFLTPM
jgi:ABC-type antimicrobial peptide transport system permease subunit